MFEKTRLKLTAWYLLIIMLISGMFSAAFYHTSTSELERFINRVQIRQQLQPKIIPGVLPGLRFGLSLQALEALEQSKRKILVTLIIINLFILAAAGIAGFFLAGRTLEPIKAMIDEQNQFISDASHELRTPLATIRAEMEAGLLEKHLTDKSARQLIKSNLEEMQTLQRLTDNLLRFSVFRHTKINGKLQKIPLSIIINDAHRGVYRLAKNKKINFKINIQDVRIKAEKNSLTEVFVILFDNAIKYSEENTQIRVTNKLTHDRIIVQVEDEGIGISDKDLPYIFDRFYRADKSRSKTEGFGLGLAIAKSVIHDHGGTISVSNKKNRGSVFSIELPLA